MPQFQSLSICYILNQKLFYRTNEYLRYDKQKLWLLDILPKSYKCMVLLFNNTGLDCDYYGKPIPQFSVHNNAYCLTYFHTNTTFNGNNIVGRKVHVKLIKATSGLVIVPLIVLKSNNKDHDYIWRASQDQVIYI